MADRAGSLIYRRLLTPETLGRWYTDEHRPVEWIAEQVGCSTTAVYDAIHRHGIPLRGPVVENRPIWTDILTADFLTEHYLRQGKTMRTIAAEVGCSTTTVGRAIERHEIPARPQHRGGVPLYEPRDAKTPPPTPVEGGVGGGDRRERVRRRRVRGRRSATGTA